jgi:ERCC4-type nuclease
VGANRVALAGDSVRLGFFFVKVNQSYKSPFVIVYDSAEKKPWDFDIVIQRDGQPTRIVQPLVKRTLPTGDYTIAGYETSIVVERKNPNDCLQSLTSSRKRFEKEMVRLQQFTWSAVVVECEWTELLRICKEKTLTSPASIDGTILAFMQRYPRTHWIFRRNRYVAQKTAWKALVRYWHDNHRRPD